MEISSRRYNHRCSLMKSTCKGNMLIVSDKDYFLSHVLCMINVDRKKNKESHLQTLITILFLFISVTFKFCFYFVPFRRVRDSSLCWCGWLACWTNFLCQNFSVIKKFIWSSFSKGLQILNVNKHMQLHSRLNSYQ